MVSGGEAICTGSHTGYATSTGDVALVSHASHVITYTHTHTHTHTYTHIHTHTYIHIHTYIHTYIHSSIHTDIDIHVRVYPAACALLCDVHMVGVAWCEDEEEETCTDAHMYTRYRSGAYEDRALL